MDGTTFFERILPLWRPVAVAEVGEAYFDGFIRRRRVELIGILDQLLAERAAKLGAIKAPPDEWTPARRAKANLTAMQIIASKKPKDVTAVDFSMRVI